MRTGAAQFGTGVTSPAVITVVVDGDTYRESDKILKVYEDEMIWGGQFIIELDNSDFSLDAKDYEGESITINNAFQGSAGSTMLPLWVHSQNFESRDGKLLLVLNCVDAWTFLAATNATVGAEYWNFPEQAPGEPDADADHYDKTIREIVTSLLATVGITLAAGDDNDSIISAQKPPIRITNARTGIRQLMEMTESYLLIKADGDAYVIKPDEHATVHSYNTLSLFFSNVVSEGVTIPNRVIYYGTDSSGTVINQSAADATSYSRLGTYIDRHLYCSKNEIRLIDTEAKLLALAEGTLAKIQGERNQGLLIAPMHCAQELFDKVSVTDSRYDTPKTATGYVHRIIREYDRGVYRITLFLGGVSSGYTPAGGNPALPLASMEDNPVPMPTSIYPWQLWKSVQPYVCDIVFSAVDKDTIAWASGTIRFKDGTTLTIDANAAQDLSAAGWLYFTEGSATLTFTTTFADVVDPTHGLVAFVAPGQETGATALILPAQGKAPLLNADIITCIHLSTIQANLGSVWCGGGDVTLDANGIRIYRDDAGDATYFQLYWGAGIVGEVFPILDGLAIFGQPWLHLYTTTNGGITIHAGTIGTAPTANDLRLEAESDMFMDVGNDLEVAVIDQCEFLIGDRFSLGTGGADPSPTQDDLFLTSMAELWLTAAEGILLSTDVTSDDIDAETTSKDIGKGTEFDEIWCDTLYYNGGSLPDGLDDLAIIKQIRNSLADPTKLDMSTVPDILKANRQKFMAKVIARLDDKDNKTRAIVTAGMMKVNSRVAEAINLKVRCVVAKSKAKSPKEKAEYDNLLLSLTRKEQKLNTLSEKLTQKFESIGTDRAERLVWWEARFEYVSKRFISVNNAVALSLGALKQATARIEALEGRIAQLEGG